MRRVGAVNHVVGRAVARRGIDGSDRLREAFSGGQAAIGLQREGDDARHARSFCGKGDASCLAAAGHGEGGNEVGAGVAKQAELEGGSFAPSAWDIGTMPLAGKMRSLRAAIQTTSGTASRSVETCGNSGLFLWS